MRSLHCGFKYQTQPMSAAQAAPNATRSAPRLIALPRLRALYPAIVPQVQHHRRPELVRVIALLAPVALEEVGERLAAQDAQAREATFQKDRLRIVAEAAGVELLHRRAEALLGAIDDVVGQDALDGLLEEIFHPAVLG